MTVENVIVDYIAAVLSKYTVQETFQADQYFDEVYRHNADVWGYLTIYLDFLGDKNIKKIWPSRFTAEIQRILKKYCYSLTYAVKPIPIAELVQELSTLHSDIEL